MSRAHVGARRILVVDEYEDAADTLREALVLHGLLVEVAYSVGRAIEVARAFRPHVVVCELCLCLSRSSGWDLVRELRADPRLADTRLIALTACARRQDVEGALRAGLDAHVRKPADVERLLGLVA